MKRILIPATIVMVALAMSASPAMGHEFFGDSPFVLEAVSSSTQTFQLGASDWVECETLELKYSPTSGASPKLLLSVKSYSKCTYNHPVVSELATPTTNSCDFTLKSSALKEEFPTVFVEGTLGTDCEIEFATTAAHCHIAIMEATPISEFQWENTDTMTNLYKSDLFFKLKALKYTVTGTGCGSSGTNGEYHGVVPLGGVIVK